MQKNEFLENEVTTLVVEQDKEKIAAILTDNRILLMKLLKLYREFTAHPHGGDPRAIDSGHENERRVRLARQTEVAFIIVAALTGGLFIWLALTIPLPWWLVLPVLMVLWLAFSWAITYALRNGLVLLLNVTPHNPNSERHCRLIFGVSFIGFLIFLVAFTLARFMAVGSPELIGLEQTLVEVFALLCAASAGALREYYSPICDLVQEIRDTMRNLTSLRTKAEAVNRDVTDVDHLLSSIAAGQVAAESNQSMTAMPQNNSSNGQQAVVQQVAKGGEK